MKPTEELMQEHTIIMHMLSGAEKLVQTMIDTHTVDIKKVENVIDFSRYFTDECHHKKEEKHLFMRLQDRGMPQGQGPIAVMLHEHHIGRSMIHGIETALRQFQAGELKSIDMISQRIQQYVELLRAHIGKENNILFPMGDKILSPDDQRSLEESFKFIEEHEIGADVHDKYHHMAHEIAA
jgi:hemerythrin-like domain-containing protein